MTVWLGTFVKGQPEEDAAGSMTRWALARMLRGLAVEIENGRVRCAMVYTKDGQELNIRATFCKGLNLKSVRG